MSMDQSPDSRRLADRSAIVTAAAAGMGRAIALRFAAEGADLLVVDLDESGLADVVAEITEAGGRAIAHAGDVSDPDLVDGVVDQATRELDHLNVIVNGAAAAGIAGDVTQISLDDWQRVLDVNLTSIYLMCHAAIPHLGEGASIVNIASQLGSVVAPRNAAYVTTKAAVIQLTKAIAVDFAEAGIRANTLSPGAVETPRLTEAYGTMKAASQSLAKRHPIGRLGRPEEVTGAAVYLAESSSTFTTGADLVVDGGYIAW